MKNSLKVPFDQRSVYACHTCGKHLKTNIVNRKLEVPTYCYKCWCTKENNRGHLMKCSK